MSENGVVTWLLQDQVSSTTVTANADGSLASEVRYSAFGEIRASTGTILTDKKYTGQQQESEIGLDFYVSRFYDPTTAHFIQMDSMVSNPGDPKTVDRYAYSNYNPINYTDPSGHNSIPLNDYIELIQQVGKFFEDLGYTIIGEPASKSINANGADMVAIKEEFGEVIDTLAIEVKNVAGSVNLGTLGQSGKYLDYGGSITRVLRGAEKFINSENNEQLKMESEAIKTGLSNGNLRNVLVTTSKNVSTAAKDQFDGVFSNFKDGTATIVKALPAVGSTISNTLSQISHIAPVPVIIPRILIDPTQNSLFRHLFGRRSIQE